jgi:hypothetical protein
LATAQLWHGCRARLGGLRNLFNLAGGPVSGGSLHSAPYATPAGTIEARRPKESKFRGWPATHNQLLVTFFLCDMAGAIHRRRVAGSEWHAGIELDDTRPEYLRTFPPTDSILSDLTLGVLMGRSVYLANTRLIRRLCPTSCTGHKIDPKRDLIASIDLGKINCSYDFATFDLF